MALLETKHTLSRLNKIKKDLLKTKAIISYISMILFLGYYLYLISLNFNNVFYLAIYSGLIASIVLFFIIELFIKEDNKLLKYEKKLTLEKKRKIKAITKTLKYLSKTLLVTTAVYETILNFNLALPNIINVCSAILLVVQILFELIINYIVNEIDYFKLSVELDLKESSSVVKKLVDFALPTKGLEEDAILSMYGTLYTPREQKMINDIKQEANIFAEEKEDKLSKLKKFLTEKKEKTPKFSIGKFFKSK